MYPFIVFLKNNILGNINSKVHITKEMIIMDLKKNVGDLDSYLRLTAGLSFMGIGISKKSSPLIIAGAMKVAEGITKFCPAMYMMGLSTNGNSENEDDYVELM